MFPVPSGAVTSINVNTNAELLTDSLIMSSVSNGKKLAYIA